MLRMNVRRGPLQKKLDALKASTHIDEEFNAVMNVNDNSNDSEPNQNLNNSLKGALFCRMYFCWRLVAVTTMDIRASLLIC